MKIGNGVEWAAHACTMLAPMAPGMGLKATKLAEYHGVPTAYMAKQLQALSKAGIVRTVRGSSGGYALARPTADISLWDILDAVEPSAKLFRCTEIRQNGPCALPRKDCVRACPIASAFHAAEAVYRDALSKITLETLLNDIVNGGSPEQWLKVAAWYGDNASPVNAGEH